ncbi:MAG: 3-isopropylmalate dehydrogenase [Desulfovibrio sp.]
MRKVVLLPGDGIGPEITNAAAKVLARATEKFTLGIETSYAALGGVAYDECGDPFPAATRDMCLAADAVFLGAVGGPKWDAVPRDLRPEIGLLRLRKALGVFANLRPVTVYPELAAFSRLRPDVVEEGVDLTVVRELTGGIYFGEPAGVETRNGKRTGWSTMIYDEDEIRRIAIVAFETAKKRRGKVCSVDKANVLHVSRLWREVVEEVHKAYPEIDLSHMYVDNAAMQLVARPAEFDVILTGNLFGDILSDLAAAIAGSLGMLSSASLGAKNPGLYEPAHGSAPDIAGQDTANPLASILSMALMLRISFNEETAATAIENAVQSVIRAGNRTADLIPVSGGVRPVSCSAMGKLVCEALG